MTRTKITKGLIRKIMALRDAGLQYREIDDELQLVGRRSYRIMNGRRAKSL